MIPHALVLIFAFWSRKTPSISRALKSQMNQTIQNSFHVVPREPNKTAMNQHGNFLGSIALTFLTNVHI